MKMIILENHYLKQFNQFILMMVLSLMLSICAYAKVNMSPLFIQLSDAMEEIKKGEIEQSKPHLLALQKEFLALSEHNSKAGKAVDNAINTAISDPQIINLDQLSKALYTFEKEQNPVNYEEKRQQFTKRIMPVYEQLQQAIDVQDLSQTQTLYKRFNTTWSANEKVVRETSLGHYGKIETAMTLLRIALLSEPANFTEMQIQVSNLKTALIDFKAGNTLQPQVSSTENAPQTLAEGIKLLEKSYLAFQSNQLEQAKKYITLFIQQWPIFEGEVSTRSGALYTRVESELPIIIIKANTAENLKQFQMIINELKQIDISLSYGIIDAMLILLREGLEAILIIVALLSALKAVNQPSAKYWIYVGVGLGIIASILGAIALHQLFPAVSAGSNREILEGLVGILAVLMMLFVGAWLHSKASIKGWNKFINKQVTQALATGNLVSMLLLSFLTVFREGAETVLFYAGMMPLIHLSDFLIGIGLALILLAIIAITFFKSSSYLPMHHLFRVMTILIYALGFKILGVSVYALQLTKILPMHVVEAVPSLPLIGLYSSWEGFAAQLIYLFLIPVIRKLFKN